MARSIKTILVSLNNEATFESNMAMVARLASNFDSHIIGLFVIPSTIVVAAPYGFGGTINMAELNRFYRSRAVIVQGRFNDYVKKHNLNAEWRLSHATGHVIADDVIDHGREADLIVIGDRPDTVVDLQFEGQLVREAGRPVLIVPSHLQLPVKFDAATVAWDASREAARAVFDGIPLLKLSNEVQVTCINPHKEKALSGDLPGAEIANTIARYDVKAVVTPIRSRKSVGKAMLEAAKNSDLLILGAYGHSRLREDLFGGVTKTILSNVPCPVLMSN